MNLLSDLKEILDGEAAYLLKIVLLMGLALLALWLGLDVFGVAAYLSQYQPGIALLFVIALALLVMRWLGDLAGLLRTYLAGIRKLQTLSPREQAIVREYLALGLESNRWPDKHEVEALVRRAVLKQLPDSDGQGAPEYTLVSWARYYLSKHPELAGMPPYPLPYCHRRS